LWSRSRPTTMSRRNRSACGRQNREPTRRGLFDCRLCRIRTGARRWMFSQEISWAPVAFTDENPLDSSQPLSHGSISLEYGTGNGDAASVRRAYACLTVYSLEQFGDYQSALNSGSSASISGDSAGLETASFRHAFTCVSECLHSLARHLGAGREWNTPALRGPRWKRDSPTWSIATKSDHEPLAPQSRLGDVQREPRTPSHSPQKAQFRPRLTMITAQLT